MGKVVLNQQKMNKMDSAFILDNFNKLKDGNDSIRLNAGITLINHLGRHNANQTDNKELNYALVRLVRSLGSSTVCIRRGFYSTFTVFLKMCPETSIEKLLSIMDTQLHPTANNSKSENTDIYIGRALLCGALIRSKLLLQSTIEIQQRVIDTLLNAGKQRSYLSFVSVMFLNNFIIQVDTETIKKVIWPIIKKDLGKPWSEQTLDSFYMLLLVRDKYPSLVDAKFLKEHLDVKDIITKESIENIFKLLMGPHRIISYRHPVYELFCNKLTSTELVIDFWKQIDKKFTKPSKNDEYITVQILQLMLPNIIDKTIIPFLLSTNFIRHMLKRFSNCKKNNDDVLVAFKKVLHSLVSATSDKDMKTKTQMNILKKLILYPSDLTIEMKTGVKVIQIITGNLRLDGIKKLCQLYKNVIQNKMAKVKEDSKIEMWTNAERNYAAHLLTRLMGHPETLLDQVWRLEQLMFLFYHGLCQVPNVGTELAPQFKDSFYRALDYKLPKLNDVRNLLSAFVHDLNFKLRFNFVQLRSPLCDETSNAWEKVIDFIEKLEKNSNDTEALPIFHTLSLHMSLQLFSDPKMAITSINDLLSCYERLIKKSKQYAKVDDVIVKEPYWVEVVVDLLLSFLSRNNHLLRSLVGCVFPHICPYLTLSAVHQILAVLDVKNYQNPLTTRTSDDDGDSSDTEDAKSDNDDVDTKEKSDSNNQVVLSEESDSEFDDENLEDEDETLTDKLRIAVRQALGDAATQTDNEDIDVDEINDDEARRLDESLTAAFRMLRENRQTRSKKQEKTSQTLTHFRVRVIDLLNIYLEICPSMAITLDIILPLFALLEFCIKDPYQKPLEHRVRACLKKLSTVKKFSNTADVDDTLLTTVLKVLVEKGVRSASVCQEINDKLAECCTFLIRCTQQVNLVTKNIVKIYVENLTAFFKKRDCVLSFILFKNVLQLCWEDNWQLVPVLVDFAFDNDIRYFRRSQALELLLIFYNNNRLLCMDTKYADMRMKLEKSLYSNTVLTLKKLCKPCTSDNEQSHSVDVQKKVQQKFIGLLFALLRFIYTHHLPKAWNWQNVRVALIIYRNQNVLSKDAKSAYNKLWAQIGVPLNVSSIKNDVEVDDNSSTDNTSCNDDEQNIKLKIGEIKASKKRAFHENYNVQKNRNKTKKKTRQIKKEAHELQTKIMSKDLKLCSLSSVNLPSDQMDVTEIQNGNSQDKCLNSKLAQKRTREQTEEKENGKSKRKKSINCS